MNNDLNNKAIIRVRKEKIKLKRQMLGLKPKPAIFEGSSNKLMRRVFNYRIDQLEAMEYALENFQEIGTLDEDMDLFSQDLIPNDIRIDSFNTTYYEKTPDGGYAIKGY